MKQAGDALARPVAAPVQAPAMAPQVALAPHASTLNRQVFGFAQAGALDSASAGYRTWNFQLLTTVAYFGVHINNDGTINTGDFGWSVWNSTALASMVAAAHAAGTRVVLTIVKQDLGSGMCSALQNGGTTVAQTVAQVNAKGVDGVNIDYEGASAGCGGSSNSALLVQLAANMRAALGQSRNLTVDTYGGSAAYGPSGDGFFNLGGLAPYVDAFFVMAYELDNDNYASAGCSSYCMSPTSPRAFYRWNDQSVAAQYVAAVGGSKTILGLPYYGWAACVQSATENAYPTTNPQWTANTQLALQGYDVGPQHTDSHDGVDHWYAGYPNSYGCTRELYMDDAGTLASKYQLVNAYGLQGAGIWSLDMGGGISSLWNAIAVSFSYVPGAPANVTACPGNGFAVVSWSPGSSGAAPISSYAIAGAPSGSATAGGLATQVVVPGLANGTSYRFTAQASNSYGAGVRSDPSNSVTPGPMPGSWPGRYHPVVPVRVVDTRTGLGGVARLGPGQTATFAPAGAGLPTTGMQALMATITAVNGTGPGYLTAFPAGACRPGTSTVNYAGGAPDANLTEVPLGGDGKVAVFNGSSASVDFLVDVSGWFSGAASSGPDGHYVPLSPSRILDTRNGTGTGGTVARLGPGQTLDLQVSSRGGVPAAGARAVALNLTATNTTAYSYLSLWPSGSPPSSPTSNLNFGPGQTQADRAVVPLGSGGKITVFNSQGWTDVIVDVNGWFTDGTNTTVTAGLLTATTPVRIVDTRDGTGGYSAPLGPGSWLSFPVAGQPGLPGSGVRAVVINLTTTGGTAGSYLSVTPAQSASIATSDLNFTAGETVANLVVATVGNDGRVYVFNSQGSTAVIVDLIGWFS